MDKGFQLSTFNVQQFAKGKLFFQLSTFNFQQFAKGKLFFQLSTFNNLPKANLQTVL